MKKYIKKLKMRAAYDAQAIWGIGHTDIGALQNARDFHDHRDVSECKTAPMSPYLAQCVADNGGDVGFSLEDDGVLYFIDDDGNLK